MHEQEIAVADGISRQGVRIRMEFDDERVVEVFGYLDLADQLLVREYFGDRVFLTMSSDPGLASRDLVLIKTAGDDAMQSMVIGPIMKSDEAWEQMRETLEKFLTEPAKTAAELTEMFDGLEDAFHDDEWPEPPPDANPVPEHPPVMPRFSTELFDVSIRKVRPTGADDYWTVRLEAVDIDELEKLNAILGDEFVIFSEPVRLPLGSAEDLVDDEESDESAEPADSSRSLIAKPSFQPGDGESVDECPCGCTSPPHQIEDPLDVPSEVPAKHFFYDVKVEYGFDAVIREFTDRRTCCVVGNDPDGGLTDILRSEQERIMREGFECTSGVELLYVPANKILSLTFTLVG
jgi:hypothetical protein